MTMPVVRRVSVELIPESRWMFEGGVQYHLRIQVDTSDRQYARNEFLRTDDFTSRFDWMMDHAKRTIRAAIERDSQQENKHDKVKKDPDAVAVHEED